MNENWFPVRHNSHYLSTLKWAYLDSLHTFSSSICVQFIDFRLNLVKFVLESGKWSQPADDTDQTHISWNLWMDTLFFGISTTWRCSFCVF